MFEKRLYAHPLHKDPSLDESYKLYEQKLKVLQGMLNFYFFYGVLFDLHILLIDLCR